MWDMVGKEPDTGSTGKTVAENIKRLRDDLSYTQLSKRLQERAGWSINPVGIRRIESGERRVTTDDLVALAVALEVSPATLLMPNAENAEDQVRITGWPHAVDASEAWKWLQTDISLGWRDRPDISAERALPTFLYRELMDEKAARIPELKARFEERKRAYGLSDGDS